MTRLAPATLLPPSLCKKKGFTLVEVMVALSVATMALLALLGTSVLAYKINHKARLRDNARSVLRTFADQFQRISYSREVIVDGVPVNLIRSIFLPTTSPTGLGLRWGQLSDETPTAGQSTVLQVDIGPPGSPQLATVTREVTFVNTANGAVSATRVADAAGFMISATFTVTYTITGTNSRPISQSISTVRLID